MRKTTIIASLLVAILPSIISAAITRRQINIFSPHVPETEQIAREKMEIVYDYTYCFDTLSRADSYTSDRMLLQISSDGISKFSSHRNLTIDSLLRSMTQEQIAEAAMSGQLRNGEFMTIYKNYPTGKITHIEKICMDWFSYEEDIPEFEWELTDSVKTILGYECMGAKCNFRGREWIVFFSSEIPIMEGPWKFCGLPGLIMEATDCRGDYSFRCIGLDSKSTRPITLYKVPFNKTHRRKFYETKHLFDINPYSYYQTTTGGKISVSDDAGNPLPGAYDPIEIPYDYIEQDWRKK